MKKGYVYWKVDQLVPREKNDFKFQETGGVVTQPVLTYDKQQKRILI